MLVTSSLSQQQRDLFTEQLVSAANYFQLPLSCEQVEQLLDYLALFIKWNKTYNLSAIRSPEDMVSKHLVDSLSLIALLSKTQGDTQDANVEKNSAQPSSLQKRYIDVGTGGGLPGIPLAICLPKSHVTLLDSAGKKTRFLFTVKQTLTLANVAIENCRVEAFYPKVGYDAVISRAFASLHDMTRLSDHLLNNHGEYWAMKGIYPTDELSELPKHYIVVAKHELSVPGVEGQRNVLVLKKTKSD